MAYGDMIAAKFQCPEGRILLFNQPVTQMAATVFISFNAPKGGSFFLTWVAIYDSTNSLLASFNAPKGGSFFLTSLTAMWKKMPEIVSMPRRADPSF